MEDFVELGLEASDKLIDHNFDKLPDQVFHPRQSLRKIRHRDKGKKHPEVDRLEGRSDTKSDHDETSSRSDRRYSRDSGREDDRYQNDRSYENKERGSRQNTRTDPYWEEAERRTRRLDGNLAAGYYAPSEDSRYTTQQRDPYLKYPPPPPSTYLHEEYSTPRRSRSINHRDRQDQVSISRPGLKKRSSSAGRASRGIGDTFSTSDRGLGAGSLGALAGGLVATEVGRKRGKGDPVLMALLGAAIGGLGANALEGRYEKKKRDREDGNARRSR